MQTSRTIDDPKRPTASPNSVNIDTSNSRKTCALWVVDISILSAKADHGPARPWRGFARDEADAKRQAIKARRAEWPGFGVCVRSCREVL